MFFISWHLNNFEWVAVDQQANDWILIKKKKNYSKYSKTKIIIALHSISRVIVFILLGQKSTADFCCIHFFQAIETFNKVDPKLASDLELKHPKWTEKQTNK